MSEFYPLASAAGMTVGLAVCALIAGLALAMIFAGWESLRIKPLAWIGTALVTLIRVAASRGKVPLPKGPRGKLTIKSISAKQRPPRKA